MDDFKWAAFKEGLAKRTIPLASFAQAIVGNVVLTDGQFKYVLNEFDKHQNTMYGILIRNEVWKLNRQ